MSEEKVQWETENLRHGGKCWCVGSEKAIFYDGLNEKGEWNAVYEMEYDNVDEFYNSEEYKKFGRDV